MVLSPLMKLAVFILALMAIIAVVLAIRLLQQPGTIEQAPDVLPPTADRDDIADLYAPMNVAQSAAFVSHIETYAAGVFGAHRVEDGWLIPDAPITLGDEPPRFGLQNLAQICATTPQSQWPEIIDAHFAGILDAQRAQPERLERIQSFEAIRDRLAVRIYPVGMIPDTLEHFARTDLPGTETVLVADWPENIVTISREQAAGWGRTDGQLFDIALANLRAMDDLPAIETGSFATGVGAYVFMGDSFYSGSMALLLDDYPQANGRFGALVSAPHRHATIIAPIDDAGIAPAIDVMLTMTARMYEEGPGSTSPLVYWYANGVFTALQEWENERSIVYAPPPRFVEMLESLPPAR